MSALAQSKTTTKTPPAVMELGSNPTPGAIQVYNLYQLLFYRRPPFWNQKVLPPFQSDHVA
jgi:hypothetical protein